MGPISIQILLQCQAPILLALGLNCIKGHLELGGLSLILLIFRQSGHYRICELSKDRFIHFHFIMITLVNSSHMEIIL